MRQICFYPIDEASYPLERFRYFVRVIVCCRRRQVRRAEIAQKQSQEEVQNLQQRGRLFDWKSFLKVENKKNIFLYTYHKVAYNYSGEEKWNARYVSY